MGHLGMFLRDDNAGASEAELLQRDKLAHALLYTSRGNPVVYFGDEQGFTGAGNDQAARQDMFASEDPEYDNVGDDAGKNDDIGSTRRRPTTTSTPATRCTRRSRASPT